MSKLDIEKRLQALEVLTDEHTPVAFFDSTEEARAYTGKANLLIVDDIGREDI